MHWASRQLRLGKAKPLSRLKVDEVVTVLASKSPMRTTVSNFSHFGNLPPLNWLLIEGAGFLGSWESRDLQP